MRILSGITGNYLKRDMVSFARLFLKKVWEVDPLECPKCHAEMKIISFISKSQPEVIRKILEHLGLWENRGQTTVSMAFKRRVLIKPWSVPYSHLFPRQASDFQWRGENQ